MEPLIHTIAPVYGPNSRVLVLGTFPSPKSRKAGFYYMHPQNRFWPILAELLDVPLPADIPRRKALLLEHNIALWDVLARCEIAGAADHSIRGAVPNDLDRILHAADICGIFTTGQKAYQLYRRYCQPRTGREAVCLPSTSPANCRMKYEDLREAYRKILAFL